MQSHNKSQLKGFGMIFVLFIITYNSLFAQHYNPIWLPSDTLTQAGNFVKYFQTAKDTYNIIWGNNKFSRTLTMEMDGSPNHFALYRNENDSVIILERGCGMPCKYAVILPLDLQKKSFEIEMPEAYDMKNNLIAYMGEEDTIIWVENFLTNRSIPIVGITSGCVFNAECTDSVSIKGHMLYLRYRTKEEQHMKEIRRRIDF